MTDDGTESFVQEVDQNLRDERMIADARRFAPYAIGAVILFVAAIGGWQLWQGYQVNEARKGAQEFSAAQQVAGTGDMNAAKAAFLALTTHGPENYRVMAQLEYGAVLQAQGDLNGALAAFDKGASETNDQTLKESAILRAAYIAAETQDYDAINRRLQPMLNSHTRLSYLAQELLAVQAWKAGKLDVARDTLQNLSLAFSAPEAVRQRAQSYLSVIGPAPAQPATNAPHNAPAQGAHP
ncbi:MAG: tetratricopeptide repeat protein [Terricaulis sp.]